MSLTKALYLIDLLEAIDTAALLIGVLSLIALAIYILMCCDLEDVKASIVIPIIILIFFNMVTCIVIPSEKTMYAMLISDNYIEIKGEAKDNIDYIFDKIDALMDEKESE